eukprot:TRINITY_DN15836_c1_g1_i2.p1 TRINITY_DN15836_c1_g1~~TRINITY_DN15836_c1_g1_i2.p1  ORF type:complete len:414 (+),score=39.03 TRINITY_DN15836_c1_g1_i2:149-1390(+)
MNQKGQKVGKILQQQTISKPNLTCTTTQSFFNIPILEFSPKNPLDRWSQPESITQFRRSYQSTQYIRNFTTSNCLLKEAKFNSKSIKISEDSDNFSNRLLCKRQLTKNPHSFQRSQWLTRFTYNYTTRIQERQNRDKCNQNGILTGIRGEFQNYFQFRCSNSIFQRQFSCQYSSLNFFRNYAAQAQEQAEEDESSESASISDRDIDVYPEGVPPYIPGNLMQEYFQQVIIQDYILRRNVTTYKNLPKVLYVKLSMEYPKIPMQKGGPPGLDQKVTTLLPPMVALEMISGQKPLLVRSTFNSAELGIRLGDILECRTTLRRLQMWNFLHKVVTIVLPRGRDFFGLPWDGVTPEEQNQLVINFEVTDLLLFPELESHFETFSKLGTLKIAVYTQNFNLADLTALLPMKATEPQTS